jgi:hypothetical protein
MKKPAYSLALAFACALLVMGAGKALADGPANVAGTWEIASHSQRGNMTQTLTLQQDGGSITGTLKGRRGESPVEGSVSGNHLNFTVKHQNQDGATMVTEYTATIDGNSMTGKAHSDRFGDREFKAKRTN